MGVLENRSWWKTFITDILVVVIGTVIATGVVMVIYKHAGGSSDNKPHIKPSARLYYDGRARLLTLTNSPNTPIWLEGIYGRNGGERCLTEKDELSILGEIPPKETVGIRIDRDELEGFDSVFITFLDKREMSPEQRTKSVFVRPPKVRVAIDYDSSQHVNWVTITAPEEQDVRIKDVMGVKKGKQGIVRVKKGEELPDSGIVRRDSPAQIPIEDSVIQDKNLYGVFIEYTDPSIPPSDTLPVRVTGSEEPVKVEPSEWWDFYPKLKVKDWMRVIVKDGPGGKVLLDTTLKRNSEQESPKIQIKRKWIAEGSCYQLEKSNGEKTDEQSLIELLKK